ncbi:MAG: DUF817 domain-containing protein [Paracoccaceae bacterium]
MTAPLPNTTPGLERRLGDWARARLPFALAELVMFVLKQGWACLFGGLLLAAIIATKLIWHPDWPIHRYDALFLFAIATQAAFLALKLETWEEARVILLFHATGTAMEWFKVSAGSWTYPEPGLFVILNVPLFSGFMYAAVGSYMARVIRIFEMTFRPYPPFWITLVFAAAIYINFFAHHFGPDIRIALFAASLALYARTRVSFTISAHRWWMPMPVAGLLSALALWIAENVGTATGTWLYSGQRPDHWVSFAKLGSWYLLLYVAFVTVTLVSQSAISAPATTAPPPATRPRPTN